MEQFEQIVRRLKTCNLSAVAREAKLARSTVTRVRDGTHAPTMKTVIRLAAALKTVGRGA